MSFTFLTPWAALVGLLALAALVALVWSERRSRRVSRSLGLRPAGAAGPLGAGACLVLVGGLLGLAAAQPVVAEVRPSSGRTDAEALVVLDISRSMLAREGVRGATRFDRARSVAKEVRAGLPGVPVGVASLTDRVLPHLFPTTNGAAFDATVDRSVGIERPPPDRSGRGRATALGALATLGTANFFPETATRRVAIVLTDGESLPVATAELEGGLAEGGVTPIFVRLWGPEERIYGDDGRPLAEYLADPDSVAELDSVANAVGGRVFEEGDAAAVAAAARDALGEGRVGPTGRRLESVELAPWAVAAAFVPLLLLLWRRNLVV